MRNKRTLKLLVILFLVAIFPISVNAANNRQEQVDKLNGVRDEIKNLDALKEEIEKDLAAASVQMKTILEEQQQVQNQIDDLEAQISANYAALDEIQLQKEKNYEAMKVRIQYMYENSPQDSILNSILSSETIGEALKDIEYCQEVYNRDREKIAEYEAAIEKEKLVFADLETQLAVLVDKTAEFATRQEELNVYIASMEGKSKEYAAQIAQAESLAAQYEEAIAKIDRENNQSSAYQGETSTHEKFSGTIGGANPIAKEDANLDKSVSYLFDDSVNPAKQTSISQIELIEYALQFVGNPYVWGGNSLTNGCDCSGFIHEIYEHFGIETVRYSQSFKYVGEAVGYSNLQPGDIIVYPGHCALYVGDGLIVEAQSKKTGITCYRAVSRPTSKITAIRRLL